MQDFAMVDVTQLLFRVYAFDTVTIIAAAIVIRQIAGRTFIETF